MLHDILHCMVWCGIMRSMHAGVKHFPLSLPQKVEIADFRSYTADIFG